MATPHTLAPAHATDPPSQPPRKPTTKPAGGFKRKRTGCMTCRKRKIKCCERKPICLNCEKARRDCDWVGGGDIFKHDQNPSVAEKRDIKFYKASASSWTEEDQQRLTIPNTSAREFQFVNTTSDAHGSPQVHPARHPPTPYPPPHQQMDLQALASAATYMPLPPTTYEENSNTSDLMESTTERSGTDAMIDPNLDGGDSVNQPPLEVIMEAARETTHEEELEKRIARVLKAAGEYPVNK